MAERRIALALAALALAPALAWAQYTGTSSEPVASTVREVLAQPRDGRLFAGGRHNRFSSCSRLLFKGYKLKTLQTFSSARATGRLCGAAKGSV